MVDQALVRRKMALILADLARLRPVAELPVEQYLADEVHELITERLLERIIGRLIDINYHLAVQAGGLPPRDYHASFLRLAELGVIGPERAQELARAAGLRNRLSHDYDGIDAARVHEAAARALEDVPDLLRAVERFVESDPATD